MWTSLSSRRAMLPETDRTETGRMCHVRPWRASSMPVPRKPRSRCSRRPRSSPSVLYGLYDVLWSVGAVFPDMTSGEPGDALLDVIDRRRRRPAVPLLRQRPGRTARRHRPTSITSTSRSCATCTPRSTRPPRDATRARSTGCGGCMRTGRSSRRCARGRWCSPRPACSTAAQCTGHWAYRDLFRKHYPAVGLQRPARS